MSIQGNFVGGIIPTAEQVGARPNTWMPTAEEVGAAPAIESVSHPGCYYRMVDGEREWINPPMVLGEEYRTTERYNGKPVYIKASELDLSPPGSKHYNIASGITHIVSIEGSTYSAAEGMTVPIEKYSANTGINVYGNFVWNVTENSVVYPIVKYTK